MSVGQDKFRVLSNGFDEQFLRPGNVASILLCSVDESLLKQLPSINIACRFVFRTISRPRALISGFTSPTILSVI